MKNRFLALVSVLTLNVCGGVNAQTTAGGFSAKIDMTGKVEYQSFGHTSNENFGSLTVIPDGDGKGNIMIRLGDDSNPVIKPSVVNKFTIDPLQTNPIDYSAIEKSITEELKRNGLEGETERVLSILNNHRGLD